MGSSFRLVLRNVSRQFRTRSVLKDISLELADGEILVILGRSGVGKSTLLNSVAGLDKDFEGVRTLRADCRLTYMMQDESLFPWRNAYQNAVFGCEVQAVSKAKYDFAEELIRLLRLSDAQHQMPTELSGGMKQRISFIRALAPRPDIFLLDEPFSSIDFDMKLEMQRIILSYVAQSGASGILVTHDFEDAATLGKRIVILKSGQLSEVYAHDDWEKHLARVAQNVGAWRRSADHLGLVNLIAEKAGADE